MKIENLDLLPKRGFRWWARALLGGVGQVMFQKKSWCGALFLAGIFVGAWQEGRIEVAWGAVVGLLAATATGALLRLEPDDGAQGLWGFNGTLVGCALMSFLKPSPLSWAVVVLGAASTTWIRRGMNRVMAPWKINSLTMPFVVVCWLFLLAARTLNHLSLEGLAAPGFPEATSSHITWSGGGLLLTGWLRGIGQVFLLDSWGAGLLFLIALWISNRWSALWAAAASALSFGTALLFGAPGAALTAGLYGFSPVLTAIALGSIFYRPTLRSALWTLTGIVMTLFAQAACNMALRPWGLPALTAPFCLVTWLFLLPMFKMEQHPHKAPFVPEPDHSNWDEENKLHLP